MDIPRIVKRLPVGRVFCSIVAIGGLLGYATEPYRKSGFSPPAFAGAALSTVGLVSLFFGLLYQRRFQRADELVRELSVVRERMHPDYRALTGHVPGWHAQGEKKIDPRWTDKHEQTNRTLRLLREYRQLFTGVPGYIRQAAQAFALLMVVTVTYWFFTFLFSLETDAVSYWLNLLALGITVEGVWRLFFLLRRVVWFAEAGTDGSLDTDLGIPSWYRLLDCRYLQSRNLPIAAIMVSHECYLTVHRHAEDWLFTLQLPMPIYGWSWRSRVIRDSNDLVPPRSQDALELSPEQVDQFFKDPGLWLEVVVQRVPVSCLKANAFDDLRVQVEVSVATNPHVFRLTVDARSCGGASGWYEGKPDRQSPHRYPYWTATVLGGELQDGQIRLVRPEDEADENVTV